MEILEARLDALFANNETAGTPAMAEALYLADSSGMKRNIETRLRQIGYPAVWVGYGTWVKVKSE
ncbi:hypothetical protein [Serinicoccus marinus]|uniref:hypothetical protein n=1 Tax=Serinicoccus marinus TaxID=247333 RepID=UPI00122DF4D6|nr:hypothetical protein [Serinicoccus marinus]